MEKSGIALFAILSAIIWGTSFPITKMGLQHISPITFAFLRYSLASLLFFLALVFSPPENIRGMNMKKIFLLGLTGVTLPTLLQNFGLNYTSAYLTGFIQSTGPIYTVILAHLFLKERINAYKILGVIIAITGVYFMIRPQGGGNFYGNMLILLSAISYSIGGIVAKDLLNEGHKPMHVISISSIAGTLLLFPLIFMERISVDVEGIKYIAFLALFTTFMAYILWYKAMEKMEVSKLSFFTYLIPIFSIISSHFFLREYMKIGTIFAGFIAVIGMAIAQKA